MGAAGWQREQPDLGMLPSGQLRKNHVKTSLQQTCPSHTLLPTPFAYPYTINEQGLQDVIGLSVTHPTWQRTRPDNEADKHTGWAFVSPGDAPLSSSTGDLRWRRGGGGKCACIVSHLWVLLTPVDVV